MDDLFKKLNTLIKSNLGDIKPELPRREPRPVDLDRQVDTLRKRINDALAHEDKLQISVVALRDEADKLDRAADAALARGDDLEARKILEQLRRTEARLHSTERDLQEHEIAVEELILQVNRLEAAAADNKAEQAARQQVEQRQAAPVVDEEPNRVYIPLEGEDGAPPQAQDSSQRMEKLSDAIKQAQERARQRIDQMDEELQTRSAQPPAAAPSTQAQPAQDAPEPTKSADDLQKRIDRLSKK